LLDFKSFAGLFYGGLLATATNTLNFVPVIDLKTRFGLNSYRTKIQMLVKMKKLVWSPGINFRYYLTSVLFSIGRIFMVTRLGFNWMQATIAATRRNAWYIDMFFLLWEKC